MIITPTKVATIESHTGHEGTTLRNTMMIATKTGKRNTSVVARPEAI
jgi:tRNA A58 N-methylase Trm61